MNTLKKLTTILAIFLSGCGGGASTSAPTTAPAPVAATPAPVVPAPAPAPTPTVTLAASVKNVAYGSTFNVNWTGTNTNACTASGNWSGALAGSGTQTITPSTLGVNTMSITCGTATASATVNVLPQETAIPDPVFATALNTMGYAVVNGKMQTSVALTITKFIISHVKYNVDLASNPLFYKYPFYQTPDNVYIKDAAGLENFVNLTDFRFEGQQVKSFNLNAMTQLTNVSLWKNPISSIDLSKNTLLTSMGLSENQLKTVDISMLPELVEIAFQNDDRARPYTTNNGVVVTGFTSIDVSKNVKLQRIYLMGNELTTLDVSKNSALQELYVRDNKLTSMNLTANKTLNSLTIDKNDLSYLNITGINNGQVPRRLYADNNPRLLQIQVTNAAAIYKHIADVIANTPAGQSPAHGIFIDPWTVLVNGN